MDVTAVVKEISTNGPWKTLGHIARSDLVGAAMLADLTPQWLEASVLVPYIKCTVEVSKPVAL